MRRSLAAALLGLLAAAPPAAAQEGADSGTPVAGGGSYESAPLLKPGTYSDTILPRETIYYAIELKAGQTLRLEADFDPPEAAVAADIYGVNVVDPLRNDVDIEDDHNVDTDQYTVVSPVVFTPELAAQDTSAGTEYRGPGRYYVTFVQPLDIEQPVESPVVFTLTVQGDASALPKPSPTPTPSATPKPTAAPKQGGGTSLGSYVAGAGGGLLAGLVLGFAGLTALRRR